MSFALVGAFALLSLAAPKDPAARGPRERPAACSVVDVGSDQAPRAFRSFRATRVVELEFEVRYLNPRQRERPPQLRLYTPDGFLYQVLETRPVPSRFFASRYRARLPVAGTSIMVSGLYGRWRVVPHEGGARQACGPDRRFVIRP
jgi:hypothetical protein